VTMLTASPPASASASASPSPSGFFGVCMSPTTRGLHSLTSQLNLSAFYGMGGARRGCIARIKGVLGVVQGVFLCQTRLKLS